MMGVDYSTLFSETAQLLQPNAIRRLFPLIQQPGMISFAGGWPDSRLFPVAEVASITADLFAEEGGYALQYGGSFGDPALLELLNGRYAIQHQLDSEKLLTMVTTGAQQGLYLLAKVLLSRGDAIGVEAPSYVGALGIFKAFHTHMVGIPMDEEGLQTAVLAERLAGGLQLKAFYTMPDFQNPSGRSMSLARRQALITLAEKYNFILIEDAPYSELRYGGSSLPPLIALDPNGRTVHTGSFSKIFAPLRIGWMLGHPDLIHKVAVAKQPIDLCTATLPQVIARRFIASGGLDRQIDTLRRAYQQKRDRMLAALDRALPPGVDWTQPEGGMFIWLTLPEGIDSETVFYAAIERKVAFVIGAPFYPDEATAPRNCLRLNFVTPTLEQIDAGIQQLGEALTALLPF